MERRSVTSRYHGSTISGDDNKTNDDGDGKEEGTIICL